MIKSISEDYKLCRNCEYNSSSEETGIHVKTICEKHGKIVDIRDEACEDYSGDENE